MQDPHAPEEIPVVIGPPETALRHERLIGDSPTGVETRLLNGRLQEHITLMVIARVIGQRLRGDLMSDPEALVLRPLREAEEQGPVRPHETGEFREHRLPIVLSAQS